MSELEDVKAEMDAWRGKNKYLFKQAHDRYQELMAKAEVKQVPKKPNKPMRKK